MERRGVKADGVEVKADADPARIAKRVALKSFILLAVCADENDVAQGSGIFMLSTTEVYYTRNISKVSNPNKSRSYCM